MFNKIIEGYRPTVAEVLALSKSSDKAIFYKLANDLRKHFLQNKVDTCSIMNARSGRCSENCKWCAQSAHHITGVKVYPLSNVQECYSQARASADNGIHKFSLVTSGRALSDKDVDDLVEIYKKLKDIDGLNLCGSFGLINKEQLLKLKNAGMSRYHCNLETSASKFKELCTTHTIEEKIQTIKYAQSLDIEVCSGGIIGMGETLLQRIELANILADLNIKSIPINILQPIKNTPLENIKPITQEEILDSFAIFRIINPKADIRFAGGRLAIKSVQKQALESGVSAILMGDMLTTIGSDIKQDFEMLKDLGYDY